MPSGRTIQGSGIDPDLVVIEKKGFVGKREVDLPNALVTSNREQRKSVSPQVELDQCPVAGTEKNDKLLGCAVLFLTAGSQENFIALLNARKRP